MTNPIPSLVAYVATRPVLGEFVEVESGEKDGRPQISFGAVRLRQSDGSGSRN